MTQNPRPLELTVGKLSERSYSASELVAGAGITADILTNYLTKSKLELCSISEGRGKARSFNILDIYTVALMNEVVRLTGKQSYSARLSERLLFGGETGSFGVPATMETADRLQQRRSDLIRNISNANGYFLDRGSNNWILFIDSQWVLEDQTKYLFVKTNPKYAFHPSELAGIRSGYSINVTWILAEVDSRMRHVFDGANK